MLRRNEALGPSRHTDLFTALTGQRASWMTLPENMGDKAFEVILVELKAK